MTGSLLPGEYTPDFGEDALVTVRVMKAVLGAVSPEVSQGLLVKGKLVIVRN